jgi:hypothetical protein
MSNGKSRGCRHASMPNVAIEHISGHRLHESRSTARAKKFHDKDAPSGARGLLRSLWSHG